MQSWKLEKLIPVAGFEQALPKIFVETIILFHRITESFWLEETLHIIKFNHNLTLAPNHEPRLNAF